MALATYSLNVAGTARPWAIGTSAANNGPSATLEPYNTHFCDGSGTGSAAQNAAYLYGKNHGSGSETAPTTLSVTPGQVIFLKYISGTINTQGSGATSCGPAGVATTGLTPLPVGESDNDTMPTNVIPGSSGVNGNGTVNTSGTAVTWVSGTKFIGAMQGFPLWINNVQFTISTVNSPTSITLSATAGTNTGVNYFYWGARTNIGGLVGAFTDNSGNIVGTPFDWASYGGVNPAGAFTLTSVSVSNGFYQGTITGGASNAFAGFWFTVAGFTNAANNGTFFCTSSSGSALTLLNVDSQTETHAATAQQISFITLRVPTGATTLSLGINDTDLHDNTGSFSFTAIVPDALGWAGDVDPFAHYPMGPLCLSSAFGGDQPKLRPSELLGTAFVGQMSAASKLIDSVGQLFPRGRN